MNKRFVHFLLLRPQPAAQEVDADAAHPLKEGLNMKATAVSGFLAPVRDVDGNFLITPAYMESLQIFPRQTLEALILVVETEFGDKVDRTGVDWAAQMPVLEVMCIVGLHAQVLDLVGDLDDEIQFDEEGHVLLLSSEDDGPWCLEDFKAELAAGLAA